MPRDERPYEKCSRLGAEHLSDVELLAVLLRTGTRGENALELAGRILYHAGGIGILGIHQFNAERLKQIKGIGNVKAIQISCISELAKRLAKASYQDTVCFTDPKTIAQYYMEDLRHEKQEHMKLLMLNSKAKLLGETTISKGTVNASLVTPRELFIAEKCSIHYHLTQSSKRRSVSKPGRYADNKKDSGCRCINWN